jgi:hypothetical protein
MGIIWVVVFMTAEPDSELVSVVGPFGDKASADRYAAEYDNPNGNVYTQAMPFTSPWL